jgi:predicted alpha/beta-hydrolase family hydrolase
MKVKKILIIFTGIIIFILVGAYMLLMTLTYDYDEEMKSYIEISTYERNIYYFTHEEARANIAYYPGGLVKAEAYLKFAHDLSIEGYNVFVAKMPLNLAILNSNAIEEMMQLVTNELPWFIGGHSLGGAAASLWLLDHQTQVEGIFYLGSYPANSVDLSQSKLNAISIYGTLDGLLNKENLIATKTLMPLETTYIEIEGGNHAQFAHYGEQNRDLLATISREDQQNQTISFLDQWIKNIVT